MLHTRKHLKLLWLTIIFIFNFSFMTSSQALAEKRVLVFAAASTTNAVEDLCRLFSEKTGIPAVASFASSSTLAKQISLRAPAGIYISANPKWMDFLEEKNHLISETRKNIMGNTLVLIAPTGGLDVQGAVGEIVLSGNLGRLGKNPVAMGDPDHVPAGDYARQALKTFGIWEKISPHAVRTKDVRTALLFVELGEAPMGIVYATDAKLSGKVKVIAEFPENSHTPISYQASVLRSKNNIEAQKFMSFMGRPEAGDIFKKYGFKVR